MWIDDYFARIGHRGPTRPSLDTLNALINAHVIAIPFENLDVLLGRPIDLSADALIDKLVHRRRGGYCFEQNGLFLLALETLGFSVRPISARVRYQRPRDYIPPRTHLFLRVELGDDSWLADVGVGGLSLTAALRLIPELEQLTPHEPRRLVREGGVWFHQVRFDDQWHDVSEFTLEEMPPIDRELANWFTSANPSSAFKARLIAARALPNRGRRSLLNRELTERRGDGVAQTRIIDHPSDLLTVLNEGFGLAFPAGTEFPCPALDWPTVTSTQR